MTQKAKIDQKIDGWVALDKPKSITSTAALAKVRRAFGAQKAGHAGTLDPLAQGVLPIALGEATKTIAFVSDTQKEYEFTLKWGEETSTDDQEGEITKTSPNRPKSDEVKAILGEFTGKIMQVPPQYSAIKVKGKRAYDLARQDKAPTLKPRQIEIHSLELIKNTKEQASFRATTGKGAYIRALARDIGRGLGTCAHIIDLIRVRVGIFSLKNSFSLDFFNNIDNSADAFKALQPVEAVLDDIPALTITQGEAERLRCGQKIAVSLKEDITQAIALYEGTLVAVLGVEKGVAQPQRVFNLN